MTTTCNRAMLVNLTISCWGGRKSDRYITQQVVSDQEADDGAGHFSKKLFAKEFLKDVVSTRNALRTRHNFLTAPWFDDGTRILSALGYIRYVSEISRLIGEFDNAVDDFMRIYESESFLTHISSYLGKMFSKEDYPKSSIVRSKFKARYTIFPFPNTNDFRVTLPEPEIQIIQKQMSDITEERIKICTQSLLKRVATTLNKAIVKLQEFDGEIPHDNNKSRVIIRKSLFRNIQELVELMPSLNIEGDHRIDQLAEEISEMEFKDIEEIRENADARQNTIREFSDFYKKVAGWLES